jgi:hypothetical protein
MVVTNPPWVDLGIFGLVYQFTGGDWALPDDHSLWTNYTFSYDFQEASGYACSVEMQVKNQDPLGLGKWIQYTNFYQGSNGWLTIRASLDQFVSPPGLPGPFDPAKVDAVVVQVRMLTPNAQYVGSFDHIRFLGPELDQGGGKVVSWYTSTNDSAGRLSIQSAGSEVQVSWVGSGVLQSAPAMTGSWTDLTNASSPFIIKLPVATQFYRLRR